MNFATHTTLHKSINRLEYFNDYCCPYSAKLFPIIQSVASSTDLPVEFVFRHQVQPWHPQSSILHEAALAVARIQPQSFIKFSQSLYEHQKSFFDKNVWNKSRAEITRELVALAHSTCGVDKAAMAQLMEYNAQDPTSLNAGSSLCYQLKQCIKYGRACGVHVSPTVLFNGVVDDNVSSSWTVEQLREWLESKIKDAEQ